MLCDKAYQLSKRIPRYRQNSILSSAWLYLRVMFCNIWFNSIIADTLQDISAASRSYSWLVIWMDIILDLSGRTIIELQVSGHIIAQKSRIKQGSLTMRDISQFGNQSASSTHLSKKQTFLSDIDILTPCFCQFVRHSDTNLFFAYGVLAISWLILFSWSFCSWLILLFIESHLPHFYGTSQIFMELYLLFSVLFLLVIYWSI